MIHVEFIGLPGGGKTTIREYLVKRLKRIDKEMYLTEEEAFLQVSKLKIDKIYRLILKILPNSVASELIEKLKGRSLMQFNAQNWFLAHWGNSFNAFLDSEIFHILSSDDRKIVITGFLQVASIFECINGQFSDSKAVFFEEGFIQKSFMFISNLQDNLDTEKTGLLRYLDNIPTPNLVIYVKTDISTCYERMLYRPTGLTERLKKIDRKTAHTFLENCNIHLDFLISWIQENPNLKLLEVHNNSGVERSLQGLTRRAIKSIDLFNK